MLINIFRQSEIPAEYRRNFLHLYFDIGWFGVVSGSAVNFLNIYAARLGATSFQIGLLGAMSAVLNLIFAIPAGRWLERRPVERAVFWTSVVYRLGYALWVIIPWLFDPPTQIWALILVSLYMGIPLTALSVGFNALFAAAVPEEYRAHVAGVRNMVLSVTFILTSVISGYLLNHMPFPSGYQVIFGIGFFGAAMSSLHLYFVRPLPGKFPAPRRDPVPDPVKSAASRPDWFTALRLDVWKTDFRRPLLVLFGFHLAQYLPLPLFSIYLVRHLHLSDTEIGIGTGLFYLMVLIGSRYLPRFVRRHGNKDVTGWGVWGMALYPILLTFSTEVWQYYGISLIGGLVWSLAGGAYANYLLERTPADDRPAHLAWYNLILNAAILLGSLVGPALSNQIGLPVALILFGILRLLAGLSILLWG
ncbi:MAG: MFS transporter [Anaerolineae bacterium]